MGVGCLSVKLSMYELFAQKWDIHRLREAKSGVGEMSEETKKKKKNPQDNSKQREIIKQLRASLFFSFNFDFPSVFFPM